MKKGESRTVLALLLAIGGKSGASQLRGRGDGVDDLVANAGLVARNSALARTCATERERLSQMERPRHPQTLCGTRGLSCYYPEAARWQKLNPEGIAKGGIKLIKGGSLLG